MISVCALIIKRVCYKPDLIFYVMKKLFVILSLLVAFVCTFVFSSCNVTRKVTTESSFYQRGDTTCTIVTKTIESYDATKKQ